MPATVILSQLGLDETSFCVGDREKRAWHGQRERDGVSDGGRRGSFPPAFDHTENKSFHALVKPLKLSRT